jgi:hypothetical protein
MLWCANPLGAAGGGLCRDCNSNRAPTHIAMVRQPKSIMKLVHSENALSVLGVLLAWGVCSCSPMQRVSSSNPAGWRDRFEVNKAALAPTGNNAWFPLQPGRVLKLAHEGERLTLTVLPETRIVDGVATAVLEEREEKNGQLVEVSRNYFATDPATRDVYYFGEDVDNYKEGRIVSHNSAWLAGQGGARFGLFLPGTPRVGDKFYQEIAPQVAMDRAEIVSLDETVTTPAGTFHHCLHVRETTPLEPGVSHKYFAPGIGLIKDDEFELVQKP